MPTRTVLRTSVFPAARREVFERLQRLETLQQIAWPFATFTPVDGGGSPRWTAGQTSAYRLRLFGMIPFGTHRIHVIRFDEMEGISTREGNEHVPIWNHEIILRERGDGQCLYTDRVEIGAGWKTPFIYAWACLFYAHRQRKWIRLLNKAKARGRRQ